MQFRVRKRGYTGLNMIASPVLALVLGGVGWASICSPGISPFLELEGNVGLSSLPGSSFDWANSGANPNGCLTSVNQTTPITCSGTGGIFDGGSFVNATTPPTPPTETAAALATFSQCSTAPGCIAAANFAVDPLAGDSVSICEGSTPGTVSSANTCDPSSPNCPSGQVCDFCGAGDPTTYTGLAGEKNGDLIAGETWGTSSGNLQPKDDISNVYAICHKSPITNPDIAGCIAGGCVPGACSTSCLSNPNCTATSEIFVGFERVISSTDSHVDLEFLQQPVTLVRGTKACTGSFNGHRTAGDFMISFEFPPGLPGLPRLFTWDCGSCPHLCSDLTTSCFADSDCASTGGTCTKICDPTPACEKLANPAGYVGALGPVGIDLNIAPVGCG